MTTNMAQVLRERARQQPDNLAIVGSGPDDRLTYAELVAEIEKVADRLREAGVKPGDCVGLHLRSGREYILAAYAIWRCGACVVPIPIELKPGEKAEVSERIGIAHMITLAKQKQVVDGRQAGDAVNLGDSLGGDTVVFPVEAARPHPAGFETINAAFIRFSSGTTGASKGVVLSHESVFDRIHAANDVLRIDPDDRVIWLLSMSYHFTVSIVGYLSFGAQVVLPANYFAKGILAAIKDHHGTFIYGSPIHYEGLIKQGDPQALETVRLAVSTTTGLTPEVGKAFHERFGMPLTQAYGIIEVGLPCINTQGADERPDAVGQVLPAFEVRLDTNSAKRDGVGEIFIRGRGLLDAYYEPWRTRDEIMDDGWFHTGDLGEFDGDRRCIRGRSKDLISVSGMKFFPQETEAVLNNTPGVKESVVFAVPNDRLGETPHAHVVLDPSASVSPTEAELRKHCVDQLASFKVPERVVIVDQIEHTASGKILRRALMHGGNGAGHVSSAASTSQV